MKNLTPEIALLVIEQLNLHEGATPSVPDDQLADGLCLKVAAHAWLEAHGGASARWPLVDLIVSALSGAAPKGANLTEPLVMISRVRLSAGRLTEDQATALRAQCSERAAIRPHGATDALQHRAEYRGALWTMASLAAVIADGQGDRDFYQALAYTMVELALFTEVSNALKTATAG
jgi:hypothetical protein